MSDLTRELYPQNTVDHVCGGIHIAQGPGVRNCSYQDEVRLVGGQHEHGDVLVGQRGDDGLGDFGHTNGLGAGKAAAA